MTVCTLCPESVRERRHKDGFRAGPEGQPEHTGPGLSYSLPQVHAETQKTKVEEGCLLMPGAPLGMAASLPPWPVPTVRSLHRSRESERLQGRPLSAEKQGLERLAVFIDLVIRTRSSG